MQGSRGFAAIAKGAPRGDRGAMTVAFAGGNGFPPEDTGGVQASTVDLAQRLSDRGHRPAVLAPLYGAGLRSARAEPQAVARALRP
jgi:hypothetical protein